jgi:uncharacterized membrane protein
MESKVKLAGHPIHPMLIVLPLGLLSSAVIFDIIYLITGNDIFPTISYYNMAFGILGGLLAAIFGFADWLSVPSGTRAKSVGGFHGIGNVVLVVLFAISWFIRGSQTGHIPTTLALIFSFAGILLGLVTAWLGGEMVDRLGVGVDRGANLDAPNSLSGAPARAPRSSAVPVTGEGNALEFPRDHTDEDQEHDLYRMK